MNLLIHRYSATIRADDGTLYQASVYASPRPNDTWTAWIEFDATDGSRHRRRTDQETSQPNRAAIEYWAGGLEAIYFEGALARAEPVEK